MKREAPHYRLLVESATGALEDAMGVPVWRVIGVTFPTGRRP